MFHGRPLLLWPCDARCTQIQLFCNDAVSHNHPDNFWDRTISFYRAMHFSAKRGIAIACRLSVCDVGEL